MGRAFCWLSLTLLAAAAPAFAQAPDVGMVGRSVRVSYWCSSPNTSGRKCVATGPLASATDVTLRLGSESDGTELIIPRASIRQVWVKDGTQSHFWAGAGLGLITGAVLGAAIGSTTEFCVMSCAPATGVGVVLGAPVGFLIGGIAGALIRSDRWRPVKSTDAGLQVYRAPGGIGVGLSIGF